MDAVHADLGPAPAQMSASVGNCSDANLRVLAAAQPERIGPPMRVEAMRAELEAGGHEGPCRLRQQLPEPVVDHIRQTPWLPPFLLQGLE
jgi:hypothetical protein